MKELLLEPLGLAHTYFFMNEIMTRRFAVGHRQDPDGTIKVARPWALPRGGAPAGGMSANAADQIAWARFHLGDGRAADGTRVLSQELLDRMKQPTVDMQRQRAGRLRRHQLAAQGRRRRARFVRPRRHDERPALVVRDGSRARLRVHRHDQLRAERAAAQRRAREVGA